MMWPMVLWGCLAIMGNGVGYYLLGQISSPIAMFNAVNFLSMLYNANNFYIQELVYEPDPAKMDGHRSRSYERITRLKKEYELMLYGSAVSVQCST